MKLIGLDVGTVRIGVARADSKVKIAVPAGMVPVDGDEFEQIGRLGRVYGTNLFVIGLPRNNDGEETAQSVYVRRFAETLKAKIPGAKVYFQDETLTSVTAEERLKHSGKSVKAKRRDGDIDAEAAVIILQDFVEHFTEKTGGKLPKEAKKQTSRAIEKQKAKASRRGLKILLIILGVLLLLGAGVGAAFIYYNIALGPVNTASSCDTCPVDADPDADANGSDDLDVSDTDDCICQTIVAFSVAEGDSTATIADQLTSAGLIRNAFIFQIFTKLNGYDGQYKAGDYQISDRLSLPEIAELLVEGSNSANVFRFTILPGETIASIKHKLQQLGYSAEALDAAFSAHYDHPVLVGKPDNGSLEGYIYGDTYEFYVGETLEHIIIRTLDELYKVVQSEDLEAAYAAEGLSLYDGITLASIVQKEARSADMPTVAQVFLTRLQRGIMLGSDVTTQYALDQVDPDRTIYTNNSAALKVAECHNTRLYTGLPCGPISNPGKVALLAVAHPADTSYLYFLTGDDGMMYYGYTESEHQQNIRKYCQVLCNKTL